MSRVYITDTSLRDGSHSVSHSYTVDEVEKVARALDEAGVDIVEVSHGDGLEGSSLNYGFSKVDEMDLISAASSVMENSRLAVLIIPGISTLEGFTEAKKRGASIARVATHVTEADTSEQYIKACKDLGYMTVGFLMMAHMAEVEKIQEQALIMQSYGADVIYVTDSAGALLPYEVAQRVEGLKKVLDVPIGHHAHDNLGLAIGNSMAAVRAGATYVDGSLGGLGAGAGNSATELLVASFSKYGVSVNADVFKTIDAAEHVMLPVMSEKERSMPERRSNAITMGYAGVYSSFMLHAQRAAKRFDLDPREILVELGRRRAVGGQEDWIIQVAYDLASKKYE